MQNKFELEMQKLYNGIYENFQESSLDKKTYLLSEIGQAEVIIPIMIKNLKNNESIFDKLMPFFQRIEEIYEEDNNITIYDPNILISNAISLVIKFYNKQHGKDCPKNTTKVLAEFVQAAQRSDFDLFERIDRDSNRKITKRYWAKIELKMIKEISDKLKHTTVQHSHHVRKDDDDDKSSYQILNKVKSTTEEFSDNDSKDDSNNFNSEITSINYFLNNEESVKAQKEKFSRYRSNSAHTKREKKNNLNLFQKYNKKSYNNLQKLGTYNSKKSFSLSKQNLWQTKIEKENSFSVFHKYNKNSSNDLQESGRYNYIKSLNNKIRDNLYFSHQIIELDNHQSSKSIDFDNHQSSKSIDFDYHQSSKSIDFDYHQSSNDIGHGMALGATMDYIHVY